MKIQTSVLIEENLHKQAKLLNIPLGKTLEEALKQTMEKDNVIEDLKRQRAEHMRKAREIKGEIEELEARQLEEKENLGDIEERIVKCLRICGRVDANEVGISNDRIAEIAKQNHVPALELIDKYRSKKVPKND